MKIYINFLNKDKNFKRDRKYFDTYLDAKNWAEKNLQSFNPDYIKYER